VANSSVLTDSTDIKGKGKGRKREMPGSSSNLPAAKKYVYLILYSEKEN
jgi:hypothetical protein